MAKTNRTMRVELSNDDLQDAVKQWAQIQGLLTSGADASVTIEVRAVTTGYGMNERDEPVGTVVLTVSDARKERGDG